MSAAAFLMLGRLLSPEDFAVVALAQVATGVAFILTDFGFGNYVIHAESADRTLRSTLLWLSLIVALILAVLQIATADMIAALLNSPDVEPVLMVLALAYPFAAISSIQVGVLRRELRFRALALRNVVASIASAGAAIALAVWGFGVWALVGQSLVYVSSAAALSWVALPWTPRLVISRKVLRPALGYGSGVFGTQMLTYAATNLDNVIVGAATNNSVLGLFVVAKRIPLMLGDVLVSATSSVSLPVFAQARTDSARLRFGYLQSVASLVLVSAPVLLPLAVAMPLLVPQVLGKQWTSAGVPAAWLVLALVPTAATWPDRGLLYAIGRTRLELLLSVAGASAILGAVAVAAPWGLTSVCAALATVYTALWVMRICVMSGTLQFRVWDLVLRLLRIWIPSATSAGLLWLVLERAEGPGLIATLSLLTGGTVIACVAVAVFASSDFSYVTKAIRESRPRRAVSQHRNAEAEGD